jgi:hypothetical protein
MWLEKVFLRSIGIKLFLKNKHLYHLSNLRCQVLFYLSIVVGNEILVSIVNVTVISL